MKQRDIVGSRRGITVTNGGKHVTTVYDEHARELTPVGTPEADPVAAENRCVQPRPPDTRVRELGHRRLLEPKRAIQRFLGIAQMHDVSNAVVIEPVIRIFGRRHVNERNLRSCRIDGRTIACDIGQRFATERSPEVPEEDHEQGRALGQALERLWQGHAAVTALCAQASSLRASS